MNCKIEPWQIVFYVLVAAVLLIAHIRLSAYAFDDAFIHFRIASNQLDFGAPYFNPGDPLKVSSSSGWVILLTGLLAATRWIGFGSSFPFIVSIFNALALFMGMWVFVWIIENLAERQLTFSERLFFQVQYLGVLFLSSWGLMETGLALLGAGWGILLLLRAKPAGIEVLALAVSIRLELIVLLGLVFVCLLIQRKFNPIHILGYAMLGMAPFMIYDFYYYGTMIPQSMIAKPMVYAITPVISFFDILLYSLPDRLIANVPALLLLGLALLSYALTNSLIGLRQRATPSGAWILVFSFWGLVIMVGYMVAHSLIFDWYRPLYMIPLIVAGSICFFAPVRPKPRAKILAYLVMASCAVLAGRTLLAGVIGPGFLNREFEAGSRVRSYQRVGSILHKYFPDASLLTSEIGGLGYSFKGEILDAVGLGSPEAMLFHPLAVPAQRSGGYVGAIPPNYVRATMPELIVSLDTFAEALLKDDVINSYNQINVPAYLPEDAANSFGETIWGSEFLRIYIRMDLPIPEEIIALAR